MILKCMIQAITVYCYNVLNVNVNLVFIESHKRKTVEYPLKSKNVSVKRPAKRDSKMRKRRIQEDLSYRSGHKVHFDRLVTKCQCE